MSTNSHADQGDGIARLIARLGYDFECAGGFLANCREWQQLKAECARLVTERDNARQLLDAIAQAKAPASSEQLVQAEMDAAVARAERDALAASLAADADRLAQAGARVGITVGCDTPDWMAEEILGLRAERDRLAASLGHQLTTVANVVDVDAAAKAIFDVVTQSIDDDDATVRGRVRTLLLTYYGRELVPGLGASEMMRALATYAQQQETDLHAHAAALFVARAENTRLAAALAEQEQLVKRWRAAHAQEQASAMEECERANQAEASLAAQAQEIEKLKAERDDARSALRYIREAHGELYGVGWDRVLPAPPVLSSADPEAT